MDVQEELDGVLRWIVVLLILLLQWLYPKVPWSPALSRMFYGHLTFPECSMVTWLCHVTLAYSVPILPFTPLYTWVFEMHGEPFSYSRFSQQLNCSRANYIYRKQKLRKVQLQIHFPEKLNKRNSLGQIHCLETNRAEKEVAVAGDKSVSTKGTFCITRARTGYAISCASYYSWVVRAKSVLLM